MAAVARSRKLDDYIYDLIPKSRVKDKESTMLQVFLWAVFGNDDDGPYGEKRTAGQEWIEKWGGQYGQPNGQGFQPGPLTFRRFCAWQLRNPLHNFTFYVIGVADRPVISREQLLLITTQKIEGRKKVNEVDIFPMKKNSGVYVALHAERPCISWRIYITIGLIGVTYKIEGYAGWRTRGQFGLACRAKAIVHDAIQIPHT